MIKPNFFQNRITGSLNYFLIFFCFVTVLSIVSCKKKEAKPEGTEDPQLSGFTIPSKTTNDISFDLNTMKPQTKSAGSFTYTSSNTSVATISGSMLTIKGAGSATITAKQAANGNFKSASIPATLTVTAVPTIPFNQITRADIVAQQDKMIAYTSTNNLSDIYVSGPEKVLKPGSVVIYKTNSGNYGKFKVVSVSTNPVLLTIDVITYNANGSVLVDNKAASIKGTYSFNLDQIAQDLVDSNKDFWLSSSANNYNFIRPRSNAIWYWYVE